MMSIDAIIHIAVLSVGAGIKASKEGDGVFFVFIWVVIVDKTALGTLGTRPTEEVVITQLVVILSFLDIVKSGLVQRYVGI